MHTMKYLSIILLFLLYNRAYSQSGKNEYLTSNRFDMRQCTIPLPDSEVKIIGFGAYHGSAKTETAELILLERLIEAKRLGYYLPEVDFCLAYYFNEYLLSGDDDLLKSLVLQYGERVPQEKSMECYDKWRSLRKTLCENNYRITVIGTDALYSYEFAMRYLSERMGDLCDSYNGFTRMRSVYEKLLDGISVPREEQLNALKGCLNDYKAHGAEMLDRFGARFDLEHLMDNINRTVCREERESTIFDNYVALSRHYGFDAGVQFVRMGFYHILKSRDSESPSFFARLLKRNVYRPDQVVTMMGYLTKSKVLWGQSAKRPSRILEKGGWGIGDCWREYFKGIRFLKRNKISDLTLFQIDGKDSPYRDCSDLIRVCSFLQKGNRHFLNNKATTDFINYAILISDSQANKPITGLNNELKGIHHF